MKKKDKLFLIISLIINFLCVGCTNTNDNISPSKRPSRLLAPHILYFGDFMTWDKVENATQYDIYCNDTFCSSISENTFYFENEITNDQDYYIVAKKGSVKSEKSNVVHVSKNCNYLDAEILDLAMKSSFSGTINQNIRKVIIGNQSSSKLSMAANILNRENDLIFEISNTSIQGTIYSDGYQRKDNNYNVIFNCTGNCSLTGDNGKNGFDYSDSNYNNKEYAAGVGEDGEDGLVVPTAIIKGNGNFTIRGGNGGNGGVGSATTTWESVNAPGKGSNGGNGGAAIKTSYLILNFESGDQNLTLVDGNGGEKGKPGTNGSIITGPTASIMWNDVYDIGKKGKTGSSVLGIRKIINGHLIHN